MAKEKTQFKPGQSGNPKGRPPGRKGKNTAIRELLDPHKKDLVEKAVDLAMAGDTTALRLCLERLYPPIKATDDPVHGDQWGKFFHGYYKCYCFLPLYAFCGGWPLAAILRPYNIDAAAGTVAQLARIIPKLRAAWPDVRIVIRGDSGFCREPIMRWCEQNHVDYLFGLAKNKRLLRALGKELHEAKQQFEQTGEAARLFKDFTYRTKKSWSKARRVVGKAEHLAKGANPRFVVTSLSAEHVAAAPLYEDRYCQRGDMENRIKEQQLSLFADRTSTHNMRSNQLRLLFSTMAYLLHLTSPGQFACP